MEQDKSLDFKNKIKQLIQDDIDLDSGEKSKEHKSDMKEFEKEQPKLDGKKFKVEVEADSKDELIKATMEAIKKLESEE